MKNQSCRRIISPVMASLAAIFLLMLSPGFLFAVSTVPAGFTERYADVNGIKLYYELHGSGKPLILIHGGLGAIEMFGPNLPALAKGRQVIAIDLQGHGRTADIDRPLSVQFMADDVAALIKHLGLQRADIMGYSLGGGVALQTAISHPEVVNKLVLVSTPFRRNGFYPDILAQQGQVTAAAAERMKQTPMYQMYASLAPRPEDWGRLLGKIGEAMKNDFDFSNDIRGLKATTTDRRRRCRHLSPRARGRNVRATRWRPAGWWLGWFGPAEIEARNSARCHALHHGQRSSAGAGGDRVPRRARCGSPLTRREIPKL